MFYDHQKNTEEKTFLFFRVDIVFLLFTATTRGFSVQVIFDSKFDGILLTDWNIMWNIKLYNRNIKWFVTEISSEI